MSELTEKKDEHENSSEEEYIVDGLACTDCAARIEEEINNLSYVDQAELNFARSTITVKKKDSDREGQNEIQQIAENIEPGVKVRRADDKTIQEFAAGEEETDKSYYWRMGIGTLLYIMALLIYQLPVMEGTFPAGGRWILYGGSYILVGGPVLRAAWLNIKKGQVFDENFLMVVATIGAFAIQEFPEAVAVMLFYMIGELFQEKAVDNSRRSIKELMDIKPDYANLVQGADVTQVDPGRVEIGDIIMVKPGEKIPLDGEVIEGESRLDTSALTGESVPRQVKEGDKALSGMINGDGLLKIKVEKEYSQSTVSRILKMVEDASSRKAPTEKFINRFARYYTPVVVYTAMAIAILPPLLLPGAVFADWFYRALIFLVVSCPCALVVSIPLGFFGGIGRASRQGVLVKGGNYLEALNKVKKIIFDKTGTLTKGVFAVEEVFPADGITEDELLKIAAQAESQSTHPIAESIIKAYDGRIEQKELKSYREISGRGIKAVVDGKDILVGNANLLKEREIDFDEFSGADTVVYVAVNEEYKGYITISDSLKDDAVKAIKELKENGIEEIIMLTGDREEVAERISKTLGVDDYRAELLPDEKVEMVENILKEMSEGDKLAFVGDGINDAPVLARSDIGIAMGALGSDAAIEAADIVLMSDEPYQVVKARETASLTRNIVWQNIIMALGIKLAVMGLGVVGMASMWEAVFADVGVALLAVFNAMRILRVK